MNSPDAKFPLPRNFTDRRPGFSFYGGDTYTMLGRGMKEKKIIRSFYENAAGVLKAGDVLKQVPSMQKYRILELNENTFQMENIETGQWCTEDYRWLSNYLVVLPQPVKKTKGRGENKMMTKEEYMAFHRECCDRMIETTRVKNADYTGKGDDPFANFTRVEKLEICSTEQGFLTRMTDKMSRLVSFSQKGFLLVKDESVEDTLIDLANYCILMAGYLRGKRQVLDTRKDDPMAAKGTNGIAVDVNA